MALPALVLDEQQDVGQGEAGVALPAREEVRIALGRRGRGHRKQVGGILGVLGEVGCHRLGCTGSQVRKTQVNSQLSAALQGCYYYRLQGVSSPMISSCINSINSEAFR